MCCLTDFTASVTTAFSPMPTEPTTLHWPAGSSVYPTRRRPARTATAPKIFTKAASGTLVLAAAGVWSSSRPSNPAASLGCGLSHRSGATAHDHHTAVAIALHRYRPTPPFHCQRPPFADSDRQLRLRPAKPGASSTKSLRRSHPRWPNPAPRRSLNRRPIRNRPIRSSSAGKFPIDRHQRRRELPRGFLPRGFSDACLRAAPPPGDWQASENPERTQRLIRDPTVGCCWVQFPGPREKAANYTFSQSKTHSPSAGEDINSTGSEPIPWITEQR